MQITIADYQSTVKADLAARDNDTTRIIDRLRVGTATTDDLAAICHKYTGRISDARKRLRKGGEDIKATRISASQWRYAIVPFLK